MSSLEDQITTIQHVPSSLHRIADGNRLLQESTERGNRALVWLLGGVANLVIAAGITGSSLVSKDVQNFAHNNEMVYGSAITIFAVAGLGMAAKGVVDAIRTPSGKKAIETMNKELDQFSNPSSQD